MLHWLRKNTIRALIFFRILPPYMLIKTPPSPSEAPTERFWRLDSAVTRWDKLASSNNYSSVLLYDLYGVKYLTLKTPSAPLVDVVPIIQ